MTTQRKQTVLSVGDVLNRSRERATTLQAKEASAQVNGTGFTDEKLSGILDYVTGVAETKVASEQPAQDKILSEMEQKIAETIALTDGLAIKEGQFLGAAIMDGMAMRAQAYEAAGVKIASSQYGDETKIAADEIISSAEALGYKTAALAIERIVADEVAQGAKLAAERAEQVKEACYNAGHWQTLQVLSQLDV